MSTGFVAIMLAATIFGSAGLFVKELEPPATAIADLRHLIPVLYFLLLEREFSEKVIARPNRKLLTAVPAASITHLPLGGIYGVVFGLIRYLLPYDGLSKVAASIASVLAYREVASAMAFG